MRQYDPCRYIAAKTDDYLPRNRNTCHFVFLHKLKVIFEFSCLWLVWKKTGKFIPHPYHINLLPGLLRRKSSVKHVGLNIDVRHCQLNKAGGFSFITSGKSEFINLT